MLFNRFSRLLPFVWSALLVSPLGAQTSIPGGANSNPSTAQGQLQPSDKDKASSDDGNGSRGDRPKGAAPQTPEGNVDCTNDDGPPKAPGSVELTFSLEACPLEYSVSVGALRLYFDSPVANMGDPVYLEYHSVAGAKIASQTTTNLPSGVLRRFTINQLSGKPLTFELRSGESVLKPYGSGADSRARSELRTDTAITTDLNQATRLRQYRSAGGYMEFSIANGNVLRWVGPTGRALNFPADPQTGTASMGLEVIRVAGKIRQVKSPAGMLDVVPDADGRGYRVITYLPSEIGGKNGELYTLVANASPQKTVHVVHPLGTKKVISTHTDHAPAGSPDRVRTLTHEYVDTFDGGHEWTLITAAEGVSFTSTRHVIPDLDRPGLRRVVREVKDGTGKLLTRKEVVQKYETSWEGWTDVQEIETPAGDPALKQVRAYRYGITAGQNDFRKLNWQMTETGLTYEYRYDATGRMIERRHPWLDGADGRCYIEKFDYTPHDPGEVVLPGDERPRTTTVEVGIPGATGNPLLAKTYFAAYNDASNGGKHTVINEDAATPASGFGASGNRRRIQIFNPEGTLPGSGRLMETIDESGLHTLTTYASRPDGGLTETKTGPLLADGTAKAGVTYKSVIEKDGSGRLLLVRESIYDGNDYAGLYEDTNTYSPQGRLLSVSRTDLQSGVQRLQASYTWQGDRLDTVTAGDGMVTQSQYDGYDRLTRLTAGAIPAASSPLGGDGYPERPAMVSETTGQTAGDLQGVEWGSRTMTVTAGSLTRQESITADGRGRPVASTNADGYTTATAYLKSGLETVVTRPDGSTERVLSYADGRIKERTGTGIVAQYYAYTVNAEGGLTTTVRLNQANGPRYQSTTVDLLGRVIRLETPGHGAAVVTATAYLGGSDKVASVVSSAPNTPATFLEYDAFVLPFRQGATVRPTPTGLDVSSVQDRIQDQELSVINDPSGIWLVTKQFLYPREGNQAADRYLLSESRVKLAGFTGNETTARKTFDHAGNWQALAIEEIPATRLRIERSTSNAFTGEAVSVYHGGLLVETRRPSDTASTRIGYDALGRVVSRKEPRHQNAFTVQYAGGGSLVASKTDPAGATTSFTYVSQGAVGAGRVATTIYPDQTVRRGRYDLKGNLLNEWGSATAPVAYSYNAYNQLVGLSTYRTETPADSSTWPVMQTVPDITSWLHEESTGLLLQKLYADNLGPAFNYDVAGRLTRRTSATGLVTEYSYTAWGEPDVTDYQDGTPDVNRDYDRVGRLILSSNGTAASSYQYSSDTLLLASETVSYDLNRDGTPELVRELARTRDSLLRPAGYQLLAGSTVESQVAYGYDAFSRLNSVTEGVAPVAKVFTYDYLANSDLLQILHAPSHTVTNTWEPNRDVLDTKANQTGTILISGFDYGVNALGQRTALEATGSAFASTRSTAWAYDTLGQLTASDSSVTGFDRAYRYDTIGNRRKSAESLTLPASDTYTVNALNQYSSLQPNPQSAIANPQYDADGNATAYPLPAQPSANVALSWDAENRLIASTANGVTTSYRYDAQGRRIAKTTGQDTRLFVYDQWNCLAEYNGTTLAKSYLWGLDQSGSLQGAGGVGGLLSLTLNNQPSTLNFYPTYDGNGNVSEYLAADGSIAAHFEYDPFGRLTVDTDANGQFDVRFSTKARDGESGLYYYGYRYYDPVTGRWLNRDPLEEEGGMNLFGFVRNDAVNQADVLGLIGVGEALDKFNRFANDNVGKIMGGLGVVGAATAASMAGPFGTHGQAAAAAASWGGPNNPFLKELAKDARFGVGTTAALDLVDNAGAITAAIRCGEDPLQVLRFSSPGEYAQSAVAAVAMGRVLRIGGAALRALGAAIPVKYTGWVHTDVRAVPGLIRGLLRGASRASTEVAETLAANNTLRSTGSALNPNIGGGSIVGSRFENEIFELATKGELSLPVMPRDFSIRHLMADVTAVTGNEVGLFRLADGSRVLRMGGPDFVGVGSDVRRVIGHTHPSGVLRFSGADIFQLNRLRQRSSVLIDPVSTMGSRVPVR
ncbi:MAG TPA: RHS repeat-associated core domain-containing protein [Luteolibacter sp.]